MPDHAALIAELEAATKGSRELSDACLIAVGWTRQDLAGGSMIWKRPEGAVFAYFHSGEDIENRLPDPTRSLDNALKWMVPEGWRAWMVREIDVGGWIWPLTNEEDHRVVRGQSNTAPLALCIASLKVRTE